MENIFDSLCSSLSSREVKIAFLKGEGIELMCLMLQEKKLSRTRAIKTLAHALQGRDGIELCEKFIELSGLKTLFAAFMGKVSSLSITFIRHILSSIFCIDRDQLLKNPKQKEQLTFQQNIFYHYFPHYSLPFLQIHHHD